MVTSRRMGWAGHVARRGGKENEYSILVPKPEGKRSLGRWDDSTKMDLREIVLDGMDRIDLAHDGGQ
jgi:hypothetical protein